MSIPDGGKIGSMTIYDLPAEIMDSKWLRKLREVGDIDLEEINEDDSEYILIDSMPLNDAMYEVRYNRISNYFELTRTMGRSYSIMVRIVWNKTHGWKRTLFVEPRYKVKMFFDANTMDYARKIGLIKGDIYNRSEAQD